MLTRDLFVRPRSVILQPETLCNLDCSYCYLPFRHKRNRMSVEVARAVAESVRPWTAYTTVDVCWHGGEPLATGRAYLGRLMDAFNDLDVKHGVQTNATLVDDAWCEFFAERDMYVGVSIDGGPSDNANRVDRKGAPAYKKVMQGIDRLIAHGHEVYAIAVVSDPTPERARRLYSFAAESGISELGVNIEEQEGVNATTNAHDQESVIGFWAELMAAWGENPAIRLRELGRTLAYVEAVLNDQDHASRRPPFIDPLPTVAHDGSVTLISPELAGFGNARGSFSSGNVLDASLDEIISRAADVPWVAEFMSGVDACRNTCPYFDFCGGGHPANRHFEHGRMDGTETDYCRNGKMALLEGVLRVVQPDTVSGADSTA